MNKYKHIVVTGFPRSGTTLLYCMLRNSVVGYRFYDKEMRALIAHEKHPNEPKITKSPLDVFAYKEIKKKIPGVGFIICIRDPRAILTSGVDEKRGFRIDWDRCYHYKEEPTQGLIEFHEAIIQMDSSFICGYEDLIYNPAARQKGIIEYFKLELKDDFENFYKYDIPPALAIRLNGIRPVSADRIDNWKKFPIRINDQFHECPELFNMLASWNYNPWIMSVNGRKRFDFLNEVIKQNNFTVGAEVGTGTGKTAMEILMNNPTLKLIQVAYYPGPNVLPDDDTAYCTCQKARKLWWRRIKRYTRSKRAIVLDCNSRKAALRVEDGSLDFVFIDADHSYRECLHDIQLWYQKVRKGGLVCGHDYGHSEFPDVERAVKQYFNNDFKLTVDNVWYVWK